jgi:hypothetical protein
MSSLLSGYDAVLCPVQWVGMTVLSPAYWLDITEFYVQSTEHKWQLYVQPTEWIWLSSMSSLLSGNDSSTSSLMSGYDTALCPVHWVDMIECNFRFSQWWVWRWQLLGYCAIQFHRCWLTFQRYLRLSLEWWVMISPVMEAVSTSEMSVNFYETTWCNIPKAVIFGYDTVLCQVYWVDMIESYVQSTE